MKTSEMIQAGRTALGIECGSTRIKAVLTDERGVPLASGGYTWESRYENGYWTYDLEDVRQGLQAAYRTLAEDVKTSYGIPLRSVGAIGISAMMHGYLVFDRNGALLTPFRTWKNTTTQEAADRLTEQLSFNIPERWSISHLYQAMLNREAHVKDISYMTTLSGYIHWLLSGRKVLGIGDASGMFPIDSGAKSFDASMLDAFDAMTEPFGYDWRIRDILPEVLTAGTDAGMLTEAGARLLDPSGVLMPGIAMAPPEGDAGTGMTATNAVSVRTGNVSAGTSIFAMIVLERPLSHVYREVDMVTTPAGDAVAMVHCNNCTSDLNAWANMFQEFSAAVGGRADMSDIYTAMFTAADHGDKDAGGLMGFNYDAGEPVTGFETGRPLFLRNEGSRFTFANFMRMQLYSAVASLAYGMDRLLEREDIVIERMYGHGGFFKTPLVGQRVMAAAMHTPIIVMETAGEGGPWGMAVLALYRLYGRKKSLADFLREDIFGDTKGTAVKPDPADEEGFAAFMKTYAAAFPVEQAATENF